MIEVTYNPEAKYKGIGFHHPDSCINIEGLRSEEEIPLMLEVIAPCASKLTQDPADYAKDVADEIQKLIDDYVESLYNAHATYRRLFSLL